MTQGPDHNSYYHELFLRGMQHLCYKMRRPTRARIDADPDFNPDFYRLSIVAPLPSQEGSDVTNIAIPNAPSVASGSGTNNKPPVPSLPSPNVLQKAGGLASLAGMNNMSSLAGMNMGLNGADNALTSNLLQQQLQQNQNGGANKFAGLSQVAQGLQNSAGGNNMSGLSAGNSEQDQLEALRQRREELVLQLQRMVGNGGNMNNPNNMNTGNQGMNSNQNASSLLNNNSGGNNSGLPNGLGNMGAMGSLFNQSFGSNPTTQLQLQQMMGLSGINGGGQNSMLGNSGAFGAGNQINGSLNMNNLSSNLSNGLSSNLGNNLSSNLNSYGGGLGGGLAGLNQQLFMQNGMGGGNGLGMNNMGLGGMNNNMMSQNLGAMLQANQFMGQQGNNGMQSDGNPFGDNNNPPSSSV